MGGRAAVMPPQEAGGPAWNHPGRGGEEGASPRPRSARLAQAYVLPTVPPGASLVPGQTGIIRGTGAAAVSKATSCLLARISGGERQRGTNPPGSRTLREWEMLWGKEPEAGFDLRKAGRSDISLES